MDHRNSGIRNQVRPGARIRWMVTMKLRPVKMEENPATKAARPAEITLANLRSNGLRWLNPANFSADAPAYYGTCGRSAFTGPGLNNWDLSVLKHFQITEGARLEFRAEAFNAFNHAQFDLPVNSVASPIFGKITAAEQPRVLQLGMKLNF